MNFLNFLTQSTSVLNFNLSNIGSQLGFGNSTLQVSTPKPINPEQIIKEPPKQEVNEPQKIEISEQKQIKPSDTQVEMFTKQQQLINQYMHLNIQLLSHKLEKLQEHEKQPKSQEPVPQVEIKSMKKKIKKINNCGHPDRQHYAKGMCNNCYHKHGRTKKPWNCPHDKLYANGMCQNCYINTYNRKRREEKNEQKHEDGEAQSQLKIEEQSQ